MLVNTRTHPSHFTHGFEVLVSGMSTVECISVTRSFVIDY